MVSRIARPTRAERMAIGTACTWKAAGEVAPAARERLGSERGRQHPGFRQSVVTISSLMSGELYRPESELSSSAVVDLGRNQDNQPVFPRATHRQLGRSVYEVVDSFGNDQTIRPRR